MPTATQREAALRDAGLTPEQKAGVIAGTGYGTSNATDAAKAANQGKPGYDVFGNPVSSSPIATSNVRRYTTATPATGGTYKTELDKFMGGLQTTPKSEADIRAEQLKAVQTQVDAIDKATATLLSEQAVIGNERQGRGRAVNARSGLTGSEMGERRTRAIEDVNAADRAAIVEAQEAKKLAVFDKANARAAELAQSEKTNALKSNELKLNFLLSKQTEARNDIKVLASAGIGLEKLADDEYQQLLDQSGYDPFIFESVYNASLPANQKKDYEYINLGGGKMVRVDKQGGEPKYFDYSTPDGFEFKMAGDIPIFVNPKTQEVKVATPTGGDAGVFAKETELDTYTDASGNRVSVMYNPTTKVTRRIVLGKTEGAPGSFKPQSIETSAVKQYLTDKGAERGWSPEQINKAINDATGDQQLFYATLNEVLGDASLASRYYKPTTIGVPVGI